MNKVIITGRLTADSELRTSQNGKSVCRFTVATNRSNKYLGAKMKRETEEMIGLYINIARHRGLLKPVDYPVILDIHWHERTKKRDADNVQSGQKYILDALQKQGILINDSRRYVKQIFHTIVDDDKDFVEVALIKAPESHEV